MQWKDWLEDWKMSNLKIKTAFLEMEWKPQDDDKNAAWDMYIELLTRVTAQYLYSEYGDEATALESIHKLFNITREIIKKYGRRCEEFSKIAIVVLNQIIRPFTAKWHKLSMEGAFDDKTECILFRNELNELQIKLRIYTQMLANMAGVEDLTDIEYQ